MAKIALGFCSEYRTTNKIKFIFTSYMVKSMNILAHTIYIKLIQQ